MSNQIRSFLISFVTVCIIFGTAVAIIAYGRGYRFDLINHALNSTGLVVIQSDPSGAQIFVDNKLKSATQATLTLSPGWYDVTVAKEGFQPWKKHVKVQGEVVNKIDALLLPINPSLNALTVSGVAVPVLSPDGSKLAYVVPAQPQATMSGVLSPTRPGVWVLDLVDKPLGLNRDARQIAQSNGLDFAKSTLSWSPDSKQILATMPEKTSYLLDSDKLSTDLQIININVVQNDWQTIKEQRKKEQLSTIPPLFTQVASTSARILSLSPDETKILYLATSAATLPQILTPAIIGTNPTEDVRTIKPNSIYVYDVKEDRNYVVVTPSMLPTPPTPTPSRSKKLTAETTLTPDPTNLLRWLPTSRHLVFVMKDKVEVMDYDGTNMRTAYAGPFWDSFAVPWASGGKIVILTNLNSTASVANNLYVVNLR